MAYNFRSIADVEVVAEPIESANVLIEENGVIKRVSKDDVISSKVALRSESHPDWNQNDPEGDGYIKNRPFHEQIQDKVLFDGVITENETTYFGSELDIQGGVEYTAIIDGVSYTATAYYDDTESQYGFDISTADDLSVYFYSRYVYAYTPPDSYNTHTLKVIQRNVNTVTPLPDKYLPSDVVRSGITQKFNNTAMEQARKNIGAIAAKDVSNNLLWHAESVSIDYYIGSYKVVLQNSAGLNKSPTTGTMVIVPNMPTISIYGDMLVNRQGIELSISGFSQLSAPIIDLSGNIFESSNEVPWNRTGEGALFLFDGSYWIFLPVFFIGGNGKRGYVGLSDSVTSSSDYDNGYAATPKAVKIAYDKAVEVESKAVLNNTKEFTLTSSTEGSTKKFRITVDDSGTLSATEVTE